MDWISDTFAYKLRLVKIPHMTTNLHGIGETLGDVDALTRVNVCGHGCLPPDAATSENYVQSTSQRRPCLRSNLPASAV